MFTTRSGRSSRNTPTVMTSSYGTCLTMSVASSTVTMRGLPDANTKPRASAPRAIARSASSSVVIPQILMNIACQHSVGSLSSLYRYLNRPNGWWTVDGVRRRLGIDQAIVEVVVVGREVEQAVTAVVEQDHPLLPRLLRRQRLVDRRPNGVTRLGRRELALGVEELHRGLERLALRVRDRLHAPAAHQARDDRRVPVVAQPAGVDRRRHELVAQRVHREQRGHPGGVAEVVVEGPFGERRARRWLRGDEPHAVLGHERQGDAAQVRAAAAAADDHVRAWVAGGGELLLGFEPDDRLVQQHVVEHRAERVVRVVTAGGVAHGVADREAERAGMVGLVDG